MDRLTPDTISAVVDMYGDVEEDLRLVLCPLASELDLNMLLGDQDGDIRNVLTEHNARTAAMRSRRNRQLKRCAGGNRSWEHDSLFDIGMRAPSTSSVNGPGRGLERINL